AGPASFGSRALAGGELRRQESAHLGSGWLSRDVFGSENISIREAQRRTLRSRQIPRGQENRNAELTGDGESGQQPDARQLLRPRVFRPDADEKGNGRDHARNDADLLG